MRILLASLVCVSGAALWIACSDTPLKSPQSDTQYDDPDDPGTGNNVTTEGDSGVMNPADAGGGRPIAMPNGNGGIGFDDIRFSATLGKVMVPAGRSGNLDLIDPASSMVTPIGGFNTLSGFDGSHNDSTTSADEGGGIIYAIDRTDKHLDVVDPVKGAIISDAVLGAPPDYVRYVAKTNEVWVTESSGIEIFALDANHTPTHAALIALNPAPQALEIDGTNGRAYTYIGPGTAAAIDVIKRTIVEQWPNGCTTGHGLKLDEAKGFLFAGCGEGTVVALDVAHMGAQVGSAMTATGVDAIAYDATRGRLYVPGITSETMTVVSADATGKLSVLGNIPIVAGAHCVAVDQSGNAYLCDSPDGWIVAIHDPF
jgi:hypothetical protein